MHIPPVTREVDTELKAFETAVFNGKNPLLLSLGSQLADVSL